MVMSSEQRSPERHADVSRERRESHEPRNDALAADQARIAEQLFAMRKEYKAIDRELASQATTLLREMADGGDIDVSRFTALTAEAARRHAGVEMPRAMSNNDDIEFVRQKIPQPAEAAKVEQSPAQVEAAQWDAWRHQLVSGGVISKDGMTSYKRPEEVGATKEQLDYALQLQRQAYMKGPSNMEANPTYKAA